MTRCIFLSLICRLLSAARSVCLTAGDEDASLVTVGFLRLNQINPFEQTLTPEHASLTLMAKSDLYKV